MEEEVGVMHTEPLTMSYWRVDLDEHIRSRINHCFVCSWRRPTWPKHPAISCYWLIDSATYVYAHQDLFASCHNICSNELLQYQQRATLVCLAAEVCELCKCMRCLLPVLGGDECPFPPCSGDLHSSHCSLEWKCDPLWFLLWGHGQLHLHHRVRARWDCLPSVPGQWGVVGHSAYLPEWVVMWHHMNVVPFHFYYLVSDKALPWQPTTCNCMYCTW